jgi:hypothetical protein
VTYDNIIYLIGTAEDLRTIHDSLAPELRDGMIDASSGRLVFRTTTRYLPAVELVSHLTREHPGTTAAILFWAEYGECHGFAVFVIGVEEYWEVGHDVPGDQDDADAQDEAARVIQDRYRSRIEQYLAMASNLRPC